MGIVATGPAWRHTAMQADSTAGDPDTAIAAAILTSRLIEDVTIRV